MLNVIDWESVAEEGGFDEGVALKAKVSGLAMRLPNQRPRLRPS
jgi:hypothetical protein